MSTIAKDKKVVGTWTEKVLTMEIKLSKKKSNRIRGM